MSINGIIDLRSDTVTLPTEEMLAAMAAAELGDDVYGEDKSTIRLQEYAAGLLGKEAALLVTSGTMGNLVAVLTHTQSRRPEIIAEYNSHIMASEGGGYAHFGSVAARPLEGRYGALDPAQVEKCVRDRENVHHPVTSLICMENTHNYAGGAVIPLDSIYAVKKVADRHKIPMHLDGARIFNAATALGVEAKQIAAPFDSVQFCLSKGLSAPIGSLLAGSSDFIGEARHFRKMLGGGMRQCGFIAAAGMVALTKMIDRLAEDHANAKMLADGLIQIPGVRIDMKTVQSNIVRVDIEETGMEAAVFAARLKEKGVLCGAQGQYIIRFVLHRHISDNDTRAAINRINEVLTSK
jgi:threonine aldolase